MAETALQFFKGDKKGEETDWRDALPVNMYAVAKEIYGTKGYMVQNYGVTLFGTASGGQCRGAFYNDRLKNQFRVQGNDFIEVDENGAENVLGAVTGYNAQIPSIPPVVMDYSFNTQAVLADGRFYLWDGVTYTEVVDPELGNPIDFCWIDGYYFFTDGEDVYHTLITDEYAIEPTDFGVAQFSPDPAIGVEKTQDNKVIVFSRYSIEYFVNDGTSDFAFSRVQSRSMKIGLAATHLKAEIDAQWYIVGGRRNQSLGVYSLNVGQQQKISTREVDKVLKPYTDEDLADSHMESYTIDGTNFLKIHLPNETLLFNQTVAMQAGIEYAWSILKSDVYGDDPDRSSYAIFDLRVGKWIVGDLLDGKIGYMDDKVSTQYDEIAEWLLFSPLIYMEDQSIDEFEIETVSGFTASNDATVFISFTYDGVFYGSERTTEYGMINEYGKRFIVRRLGYIRDTFSMKLKGASRSRMAFARGMIQHG